jgi:hypothetical protein
VTRPYHSPSSISLGRQCHYAWARQYVDGVRDPNIPWREEFTELRWDHGLGLFVLPRTGERITAAQRGSALGLGLHATAERRFDPNRGEPDWHWFPGQVLASGLHLLPEPSAIERVRIEQEIGDQCLHVRDSVRDGAPTTYIEVGGVRWAGFVDLEAHGGDELARLGIRAPDGVAVIDYKSTSDIAKHAKTHAELLADPQGALYAIAVGSRLGLRSVPERWVYFESKRVRRALAIDVTAELSRAHDVIGPCADLARQLDMISQSADAPKNPAKSVTENGVTIPACKLYGPPDRINCRHHITNGGTCDYQGRRFGSVVHQISKKKEIKETMETMTAEGRKAAFEAKKAEMAAKKNAAAGEVDESEAKSDEAEEAESEEAVAEPKPTVKPKPAGAKPPAKPDVAGITVLIEGFSFTVPAGTVIGKALIRASKSLQAAASAFEGG